MSTNNALHRCRSRAVTTNTNTAASSRVVKASMSAQPSLVEWKKLRFVIMDAPKANNLHLYLRELKKQNVVCVVRVCEVTYPASEVEAAGIKVRVNRPDNVETSMLCIVDVIETFGTDKYIFYFCFLLAADGDGVR